jgi:hypothetical protein
MTRHLVLAVLVAFPFVSSDRAAGQGGPALMAVFALNGPFGSSFAADVDRVPGTPNLSFGGNNALSTPFAGTPFNDLEGTAYPAGNAIAYGGNNPWIANGVTLTFNRNHYRQIIFSFDYFSTKQSGAAIGIRDPQRDSVYSLIHGFDIAGDQQWHRVTHTFDLTTLPTLFSNGAANLNIGLGPNLASLGGNLRFDNFQVVGFPEPSAGAAAVLSVGAGLTARRRRRVTRC